MNDMFKKEDFLYTLKVMCSKMWFFEHKGAARANCYGVKRSGNHGTNVIDLDPNATALGHCPSLRRNDSLSRWKNQTVRRDNWECR